jgi:hypothetical protein
MLKNKYAAYLHISNWRMNFLFSSYLYFFSSIYERWIAKARDAFSLILNFAFVAAQFENKILQDSLLQDENRFKWNS